MKLKECENWHCCLLSGWLMNVTLAGGPGSFLVAFIVSAGVVCGAPVPNPSLEESGANGPAGWTFTGPRLARSAAWIGDGAFDGTHALRIDARHGTQFWESGPIRVRPNQKYLARWQARFLGEKSWRFHADFCGFEVLFKDEKGQDIGSAREHTVCWQTRGWQPGWFLLTTPVQTRSANVRFAIETEKPLPGGFDIDCVELIEWPPAPPPRNSKLGLAVLNIKDERGQPVAARIRITDSEGKSVRPFGCISYEQVNGAFHSLEEGVCYAILPRGTYSVVVTKGFEYGPWESQIQVTKQKNNVLVRLNRLWDWRERGWFAGDHHTHLYRHGGSLFPFLNWPDVMRVARCEGLDFLPFMGADKYPDHLEDTPSNRQPAGFVCELTEEITEDFWGHVCPIGVGSEARRDRRYNQGPMHFDRYAAIASFGGVLSYGHPHGPLGDGDDLEAVAKFGMGHVARELPIDLALGIPCAMDLLTMEGPRNQLERKLKDLYRLWNLGFRPAVAGSTDFHVDQGRQPIGSARTYVRSGVLDMRAIAQAYREGHTFATSGPLLDLQVAGAGPGDEVSLPAGGERVHVKVEAVSIGTLERAEIVVNGTVHQTFISNQPHRITGSCDVSCDRSSWITARVYGPEDPHLAKQLEGRSLGAAQFAHTSPVYVLVGGRNPRTAETSDAEYFVRWCDAVRSAWKGNDAVIAERLERARKVFVDLATPAGN